MSKGKIIAIVGLLVVAYVAAAPYITVRQIRSAAASQDGDALSEYIDFPSVRQSIKDQIYAAFVRELSKDKKASENATAAFGAAIAGVIVDKLVDACVTPAGLTSLMAGETPNTDEEGLQGSQGRQPLSDATMSYESVSKFAVVVRADNGDEVRLILRRHGIGWKLTEIIMPLER